jgi:hypothetical protein
MQLARYLASHIVGSHLFLVLNHLQLPLTWGRGVRERLGDDDVLPTNHRLSFGFDYNSLVCSPAVSSLHGSRTLVTLNVREVTRTNSEEFFLRYII